MACQAVCVVYGEAGGKSIGHLRLSQADTSAPTQIQGTLTGLTAGLHGLTVCTYGDMSEGAASCGKIFNPFGKTHGSPEDDNHMAGDMGNIKADENGVAAVDLTLKSVFLFGPHTVIGRSIVVYAGQDDQGRGGHDNSGTTGNAGPRIAAGIVGLAAST